MGRKFRGDKNQANPEWKTISPPYSYVAAISEYIDGNPSLAWGGISDFVMAKLRAEPEFQVALREYIEKHKAESEAKAAV